MGFVAICAAIYDYEAHAEGELDIKEGELLYILEKSDELDWWKAKKKAGPDDDDEPVGLIPNNYVEEAKPIHTAKALYEYTRQTDEEVSFTEDATLEVYDTSDSDWTLVGVNGDYGFAPANYIQITQTSPPSPASVKQTSFTPAAAVTGSTTADRSPTTPHLPPADSIARVLLATPRSPIAARAPPAPRQQFTPEASDEETEEPAPALPPRPAAQSPSPTRTRYESAHEVEPPGVLPSPPYNRAVSRDLSDESQVRTSGGYRLYNVSEMVSAMGRRRKMRTTLGLNLATGSIMLSPESSNDGPSQEWTADKLTLYSIEGKHVFMELIRPSKDLDLHAGTKDTAEEIVAALGEIAGAVRGEGIREVLAAANGGTGQKKGQMLYEFMAQGDDEVTVAAGDEVIILDDSNEDWWRLRRVKNGKEGVVPSSYVEVTGTISAQPVSRSGLNAGRSTVEQNRLEEERLAKEAAKSNRSRGDSGSGEGSSSRDVEVGPGMKLPQRGSSLGAEDDGRRGSGKDRRESRAEGRGSKPKPDPKKTRIWTDRTKSFKVEAQFLALSDGKIHLHKQNGVKIAVPTSKMSVEDLEYVESVTGLSLDEDKPLSAMSRKEKPPTESPKPKSNASGVSVDRPKPPEYDWFDFFLKAGVNAHQCERYAQAMTRDSMDESVLPDITPDVLRSLGLKEGDILKVMKYLDAKFARTKARNESTVDDAAVDAAKANGSAGGLFTGPGGVLQNNTRRGRPEANRQTNDVVDANAFDQSGGESKEEASGSKATVAGASRAKEQSGFDDDAWEVKPPKQASIARPAASPTSVPPSKPSLSGALADLSLLSAPLQPTVVTQQPVQQPAQQQGPSQQPQQTSQTQTETGQQSQQGANPNFFSQLNQQQPTSNNQGVFTQPQQSGVMNFQTTSQINPPRQRPQPPTQNFGPGSILLPPPRPLSAPQNVAQPNQFGLRPLQPQLTGIPQTSPPQAPPGHSLNELNQQRFQQQYGQPTLQSQPTGFAPQAPGMLPFATGLQPLQPQQTAFIAPQQQFANFPQQQQQPYLNGNIAGSPFADSRSTFQPSLQPQTTSFGSFSQQGAPAGGINSVLPPALQPQPAAFLSQQPQASSFQPQQPGFQQAQQTGFRQQTGFLQPQQTGFMPFPQQNGFRDPNFQVPPVPPIPQQNTVAPLLPQKTGPAPPVRFGVTETKKLAPQPTGRRANLSQATPDNPFGFT